MKYRDAAIGLEPNLLDIVQFRCLPGTGRCNDNFFCHPLVLHGLPENGIVGETMPVEDLTERIEAARNKLFAAREKRVHPHKDDKILTDGNGLSIAALAKAGRK